jgi:Ser/Thr protein kinase RdoA (MazF antagonist)
VEITEEIRLLNYLKQHDIPVSYPIPDKESLYIQTLNAPEGDRFAVLFSYAYGEKLLNYSAETHFRVGKLMAEMHIVTNNMTLHRVSYTPEILLVDSIKQIEKFLPGDTKEMEFMQSAQRYLLQELLKVNVGGLRQGVVHLDIWFDNINIADENKITIFDFDFCGNGWLCLDIAYYILQVNSVERDESACTLKVNSFLEGYESVIKLSDEEKRLIPMLGVSLYFFYLGVQCQRYENWSNSFFSEMYLKRFINALVKRYFDLNNLGPK